MRYQKFHGAPCAAILTDSLQSVHALMPASRACGTLTNTTIRSDFKTIRVPGKHGDDESTNAATASINITVARLGDVAFVGWGGEVFNEIGQLVKAKSPFRHTFILTHCNGAAGYLPLSSCYADGGYEV